MMWSGDAEQVGVYVFLMFLNMLMLDDSLLTGKPGVSSNCGLPNGELLWQFAMDDEPGMSVCLVVAML